MTTPTLEKKPTDLNSAAALLAEQIKEFDRRAMICKTQEEFIRFEIPVRRCDPIRWLSQQEGTPKFFWAEKEGTGSVAAVGAADIMTGNKKINYQYLHKQISSNLSSKQPALRYYGGCVFDSNHVSEEWKEFGAYYFFIPRFELVTDRQNNFLACNIARREFIQDKISQIVQQLLSLRFKSHENAEAIFQVQAREDFPEKQLWCSQIKGQLKLISDGVIKKIVLARRTALNLKSIIPPFVIMQRLRSLTPECFHFYLQVSPNKVFLGASPERLFRREGKNLLTEALAGTSPRGTTKKEDAALRETLLTSRKELLEHQLVIDGIVQVLRKICREVEIDRKNSLLKLEGGHHLLTKISATLGDEVNDAAILFHLHPTPAVAGTPTETALKTIEKEEPFSRGWYAGPIGYFGHDSSEFAVAIRCGLIDENHISLYAGAGIVTGSDPEKEWQEIENKISIYLRILNHEVR